MIHTNKVRRILRAKNGSQIPKFLNPAGPFLLSSFWTNPTLNTQTSSIFGLSLSNSFANNYSNALYNPTTLGSLIAAPKPNSIDVSGKLDNAVKSFSSRFDADAETERIKLQIKNNSLSGKVGNFISKNSALIGMGLDYANNQLFGDLKQSSGMDTVTNLLNYAGIGGKAISFGMNALDSLGGENFNFKLNTEFASDAGASYQNLVNDALRLQSKSGNYGLSSRSKLNKAKREKAKISKDIAQTMDILNTSKDQKQVGANDLNYIQYNMDINGGYDLRYIRAAKSGMKLSDKISLIKSRKYVDHYIDLNSKLVEEFAKGGTIDWEPTIDIFEPVIEIPEFLKGGLIEELYDFSQESEDYPQEYKDFKNSLPKNQRLTPESEYRTYLYWQLWGKPKNFQYTLNHPDEDGNYMYTWDDSDHSYHGNSIAWKDGMGYFIKPKGHPTLKYELDYYNKGLITEKGGKQRPAKGQELKDWLNFKNNYDLVEDGNFYKYAPKLTNKNEWEPTIEILDTHIVGLPEYKSGGKTRTLEELIEYAKLQNPRFIQRLSESPRGIKFTDDEGNEGEGSHYLEWSTDDFGNAVIYPRIQEIEDGSLKFFPSNEAYLRAIKTKNILTMSPEEANTFFSEDSEYKTAYKRGWPNFFKLFKDGGKTKEELETPEIEETTQKNIIPEGALHKNKHHIEHTEGLTKKGIPVVDNDGNLQAEVEKEEIIFSLEVTKKLEELYKDYYDSDKSLKEKDEAAIEAGKLLVYQILFNTDDRTGLIKRCEEGGKL